MYGTTTEQVGSTGIVLRPNSSMYITFNEMEDLYRDMEQCTGFTAVGPIVEYTYFPDRFGTIGSWAVYVYIHQLVMMNTYEDDRERNCHSDTEAIKHEFVHHLLYMNGQVAGHENPLFQQCASGVRTCNGVPC